MIEMEFPVTSCQFPENSHYPSLSPDWRGNGGDGGGGGDGENGFRRHSAVSIQGSAISFQETHRLICEICGDCDGGGLICRK